MKENSKLEFWPFKMSETKSYEPSPPLPTFPASGWCVPAFAGLFQEVCECSQHMKVHPSVDRIQNHQIWRYSAFAGRLKRKAVKCSGEQKH